MAEQALTPLDGAPSRTALQRAAAEAVTIAGGVEDHDHLVAGAVVRLRFAGTDLVTPMTRPLSHLRIPTAAEPDLTIQVWSGAVPGGWRPGAGGGATQRRLEEGEAFVEWRGGSLSGLDPEHREAWCWARTAADVDVAAPLSPILRPWLALQGIELVHAAAVGTPDGCVLIVGGRGTGKSTAVLACLADGLGCIGDDTCLIGSEAQPVVHSLYRSVQVDAGALDGAPFLVDAPGERDGRGRSLAILRSGALVPAAPLRAVAIVGAASDAVARPLLATAGEALAALAPTSVLRMHGSAQGTLSRLAQVLQGVPCHHLPAQMDPGAVAAAVRTLL